VTQTATPHGEQALPRARARKASEASVAAPLPSLVHTTCNILHRHYENNEPIYVDDAETHRFRVAVAAVVAELGWSNRAMSLALCGKAGVEVKCGGCTTPSLVPFRCGARTCPTCARAGAGAVAARVANRIAVHDAAMSGVDWDGAKRRQTQHWQCPVHQRACKCWQLRQWRLVTLTRRPVDLGDRWNPHNVRAQLKQAGSLLAAWWRRVEWGRQVRDADSGRKRSRKDTSCVWGLEVAPGGMVHFHVTVYGEFLNQVELLKAWREVLCAAGVTDRKDGGVRVEALRGEGVRDSIREVLKYATKGTQKDGESQMPSAQQAGVVEVAFQNVRRVGIKGALRKFAEPEVLDVHLEDLHNDHVLTCEACGNVGEWTWGAIVGRDLVQRNHGFGLLRYNALGQDYGGWIILDKPDIGFCDDTEVIAFWDGLEPSDLFTLEN
jgi:hypothetical protein